MRIALLCTLTSALCLPVRAHAQDDASTPPIPSATEQAPAAPAASDAGAQDTPAHAPGDPVALAPATGAERPALESTSAGPRGPGATAPAASHAVEGPASTPSGPQPGAALGAHHTPATRKNRWGDPANRRYAASRSGAVGLLNVSSADPGPRGVVRLTLSGEFFEFADFPVQGAFHSRSAGTLSISYVPLEFLELFLAYGVSSNDNSRTAPRLIQSLGDVSLGLKATRRWFKGFHAGLELQGHSYSAVGNPSGSGTAFGFSPRLLTTWDVRTVNPRVPTVFHLNVGAKLDGTGDLVGGRPLTASEEYALGVNRYDRLTLGAGVELPLPAVTPFLEYNLARPFGVKGGLVGPDGAPVSISQASPMTVGGGVRVTALRDFSFTAGVDVATSRRVARGIAATAPWNLTVAASYNLDPFATASVSSGMEPVAPISPPRALPELPKVSRVGGVVLDAATGEPLPGVILTLEGTGLPPVASDQGDGRFLTQELPVGPVRIVARKEGYRDVTHEVLLESGQVPQVEISLAALPKPARLTVAATSGGKTLEEAIVKLQGPHAKAVRRKGDPLGMEAPAGKYTVVVEAEGYLSQQKEIELEDGEELVLTFDLMAEPKKKLVVVQENKIEILQQVHFASGKARILGDSYQLLDQVAHAITSNGIKKLRVEGHTDNKGGKAKNLKLSQDRAQSVREYLVKRGVPGDVVESVGYGDARPVAPNLTPRGRELNRRVEFIILEH